MNEQDVERRLETLGKAAPRITADTLDASIVGSFYHRVPGTLITLCVLTLYNNLQVVGINMGPVSADNFDEAIGANLAFKDAREKVWPILGAILAENIHRGVAESAVSARLSQAEGALAAMGYGYSHDAEAYVRFAEDAAVAEIPVADTGGFPVEVAQPDPAEELPGPQSEGEAVDKAVDESEGQNAESADLS